MKKFGPYLPLLLILTACSQSAQQAAGNAPRDLRVAAATRTVCIGPHWHAPLNERLTASSQEEWRAWRTNLARCQGQFTEAITQMVPEWASFAAREDAEREALALGPYGRREITFAEMLSRSSSITARYEAVFNQLWQARLASLQAAAQAEAQDNAGALAAASIALGVLSIGVGAASFALPTPAPSITIIQ